MAGEQQSGRQSEPKTEQKRAELAAFLRSRRERIRPEDVDLPAGARRRTPGLRREEVAQLAGVGVTWYTWLEQGRPIHVSVQVLEAVARTLRLDTTERTHLFRLAELPGAEDLAEPCAKCPLPDEFQDVLDGFSYPASVVTEMFHLVAWNAPYAALFPNLTSALPEDRNTLLTHLTAPSCCHPVENREQQITAMVAQLRNSYGRHVGDPEWTRFITRLTAVSDMFAEAWNSHDVAQPAHFSKVFRHAALGRISVTSTSFEVRAVPGARLVVYTAADPGSKRALLQLTAADNASARFPCWTTHQASRVLASAPA
jgi:transcriptional regulator with XRE-family HTH domain